MRRNSVKWGTTVSVSRLSFLVHSRLYCPVLMPWVGKEIIVCPLVWLLHAHGLRVLTQLRVMLTSPLPSAQPSPSSDVTERVTSSHPVNWQVGAGFLHAFWSRVLFHQRAVPRPVDSCPLPLTLRGAAWPPQKGECGGRAAA